ARQHTDVHVDGPVPDLERIAPEAFIAAAEIFLKRPLTMAELAELNARFTSSGYDFAAWVQDHLGVPLKQRDGHLAEPFAALLARVFPERRDAQKWNAVWDVCDRVLQLAKRPRPLPQMAIGLAGRGRKA
ncbi:MAG: hypothetical protein ACRDFA_04960, partial [bacterium]